MFLPKLVGSNVLEFHAKDLRTYSLDEIENLNNYDIVKKPNPKIHDCLLKNYNDLIQTQVEINELTDTNMIPINTKRIYYDRDRIIDFIIPSSVRKLYFYKLYEHPLDFITNTNIKILGWRFEPPTFINYLPNTINTLIIGFLCKPLLNIPTNIQKIIICNGQLTKKLLIESKFPFNCQIYYKFETFDGKNNNYIKLEV